MIGRRRWLRRIKKRDVMGKDKKAEKEQRRKCLKESMRQTGWLSDWDTVKENESDICHGGLGAAGFIPVFGVIPDVINVYIYAAEGNELNAAMSFSVAIPGVEDIRTIVGKGGKYLLKGGRKLLKALKKSKLLGKQS